MNLLLLAQITKDTNLILPLSAVGVLLIGLIGTTWKAANYLRDSRDEIRGLREDLRTTWSFRDQERWALRLERENRKLGLYVPDVERAPTDEKQP